MEVGDKVKYGYIIQYNHIGGIILTSDDEEITFGNLNISNEYNELLQHIKKLDPDRKENLLNLNTPGKDITIGNGIIKEYELEHDEWKIISIIHPHEEYGLTVNLELHEVHIRYGRLNHSYIDGCRRDVYDSLDYFLKSTKLFL